MKANLVVTAHFDSNELTERATQGLELAYDRLGEDVAEQIARAFISRVAEALRFGRLVAWAHSREEAFIGRNPIDSRADRAKAPASGWMGCWSENFDFFPDVLNKVLRKFGYQPDAVLRGWHNRGWILWSIKAASTKVNIDGEGEPDVSMVSILRKAISEAEG